MHFNSNKLKTNEGTKPTAKKKRSTEYMLLLNLGLDFFILNVFSIKEAAAQMKRSNDNNTQTTTALGRYK